MLLSRTVTSIIIEGANWALYGGDARLPEGETWLGRVDLPAFGGVGACCTLLAEVCQGQARTVGVVRCLTPGVWR